MGRINRLLGKVKSEIVGIDPQILSVRLENGTFLGPEIVKYSDGMYRIAPGHESLAYIPENVARIEKEGWNVRHNYGDMDKLVASIEAVSAVREPLSVIFDTNRLVLLDGHRRHYALWLLREKGVVLKEVSVIVNSFGKGESYRSFEYAMLSSGSDKELLSIGDKARLIDRHLKEDLKNGLTAEEAKAAFLENTGWG